jgi:hypothetical protein
VENVMRFALKRGVTSSIISILVSSNIFLFGPYILYRGNINEFVVPFASILKYFLFPALIIVVVLNIIGLLLPEKIYQRYISILFILGLLTWLQGNFLVWEYGLLDGQGIDWGKNVWRGWVDGLIWCVFLIMAFIFSRRISKKAVIGSLLLFSVQVVSVIIMSVKMPEMWSDEEKFSLSEPPPEVMYELSSNQNVIHILFDSFQSDIFHEIIDEERDYYADALEGFTFFKEATGAFPTTYMSIPAIFSGQNYKNDIPMANFIRSIMRKGKTITNVLYNSGCDIDFAGINISYDQAKHTNFYLIPTPYGVTKEDYERVNSSFMLDLVLFRYAPHFLKKLIYNNQLWMIQHLISSHALEKKSFRYFSHTAFLQDLIENIHVKRAKPVYKFIHLITTHAPVVVNRNCEYAGKILLGDRENTKTQAKCSLYHLIDFLNRLKLIDIYDSSLIIIQADTGAGKNIKMNNLDKSMHESLSSINNDSLSHIAACALPLLVIKPPYSKGALRISKAQVMLTDVPATISSILDIKEKFMGRSAFEIDPNETRERKFYYYEWQHKNWQSQYLDYLTEFIIKGSVFDKTSWQLGPTYHSPKRISYKTEKIDFGTDKALQFFRFGWSGNEISTEGETFNWAIGNSASLFLSLPKDKAVVLTANIQSLSFDKPQVIIIKVDSRKIGTWKLTPPWKLEKHSIVIEPDKDRPDMNIVEFNFSQYRQPTGDPRTLAVAFESITLSEETSYK